MRWLPLWRDLGLQGLPIDVGNYKIRAKILYENGKHASDFDWGFVKYTKFSTMVRRRSAVDNGLDI